MSEQAKKPVVNFAQIADLTPEQDAAAQEYCMKVMQYAEAFGQAIIERSQETLSNGDTTHVHAVLQCEKLFAQLGFDALDAMVVVCSLVARIAREISAETDADVRKAAICNAAGLGAAIVFDLAKSFEQRHPDPEERAKAANAVIKELADKANAIQEAAGATKQ